MSEISPQLVRDLRDKTGAGMMDCKKALTEAKGDLEAAVDILRKSGIAKAEKKSGRTVKEGLISSKISGEAGVLVEVLCETDFVAKNEKFKAYAAEMAEKVLALKATNDVSEAINESEKQNLVSMVATIGENLQIRRAVRWGGKCASYLHMGGRIGVMIQFEGEGPQTELNDICMHIAAFNPTYVSSEDIPSEVIAREKEIHTAQLAGKPAQMIEGILKGKLAKWYKEVCLNDQAWMRDDKLTVKQANPKISVKKFVRWQVGEA
ncbi:MAG TPA: elongation factor Ts [Lentisphaeria bacterium]|nr:MAG: translation elongation factor Ts [Lentisphaerae bacterium GWF2_38_69]HBM15789.1 elongation factor Ts [Lentisphaeria bacterium]